LEAAFTFGGLSDAPKIAEYIIQRRRVKPFENIEDLRKSLLSHSASIQKCESFIAVTSSCFTIKVTVISGSAKVSAVAAVTKEGNKIKPIGVISD
jgi:type II secretory pathway component PulK